MKLSLTCTNCGSDKIVVCAPDRVGFVSSIQCGPCGFVSVLFSDLRRPRDGAHEVCTPQTQAELGAAACTVVALFPAG
jgi:hypothetical protein